MLDRILVQARSLLHEQGPVRSLRDGDLGFKIACLIDTHLQSHRCLRLSALVVLDAVGQAPLLLQVLSLLENLGALLFIDAPLLL